jgi:hypothetical protein
MMEFVISSITAMSVMPRVEGNVSAALKVEEILGSVVWSTQKQQRVAT